MAANAGIFFVLAMHHGHSIPAHQALYAAFQGAVTGIRRFLRRRDGVDVVSVQLNRYIYSRFAGAAGKGVEETSGLAGAFLIYDFVKSLNPFGNFLKVGV